MSAGLTPDACNRTRTSPRPACGAGCSPNCSTSAAGPWRVYQTAFMFTPLSATLAGRIGKGRGYREHDAAFEAICPCGNHHFFNVFQRHIFRRAAEPGKLLWFALYVTMAYRQRPSPNPDRRLCKPPRTSIDPDREARCPGQAPDCADPRHLHRARETEAVRTRTGDRDIMTTLELTLNLPDELASKAQAAGLLNSEAIEKLLREQLRKQAGQELRAMMDRVSADG